jgi:hypothetical protein
MSTYCIYQGSTRNNKHVCSYDDSICNNNCPKGATGSYGESSIVGIDVKIPNYKELLWEQFCKNLKLKD